MGNLLKSWKFSKGDMEAASTVGFDDSAWRVVRVPHDYAIEGPFDPENDKQVEKVVADGIDDAIVHIARTGGLPICDPAWYRTNFSVSDSAEKIFIEFDGVMCNSTVYVNGIACGGRVYGYSSFSVDVTDAVHVGDDNVVAVSTRPVDTASRWYPGAGIYRKVTLVEKKAQYFPYCPAFVVANIVDDVANVTCKMDVVSDTSYSVTYRIKDANGVEIASKTITDDKDKSEVAFTLAEFTRWESLNAYLYTMEMELVVDGEIVDQYATTFGVRSLAFDANKGFFLNDKKLKMQGVCLHHDAGALGAGVNKSVIKRQLSKLIEIGVNAIRTSHNPPAIELLDLCDEFGLIVIDEAFDEWKTKKVANGYGDHFDVCAEEDISTMIRRDRNHPCVILWSIGNEILEQIEVDGWKVAKYLSDICHREDPTRLTTAGFNMSDGAFANGLYKEVDVVGVNYKPHLYEKYHKEYPDVILYGSETSSCISSRGEYYLPAEVSYPATLRDNYQISSFDLEGPVWACSPDKEFYAQDKCEFILGEFMWTGFDYIGEPTPYREEWPSRSSYFGIFDLAGMEKDRYYSYKSQWTDKEVLHVFPHWNWNEGEEVDVHCYASFDEVELFVNGVSQGISKKFSHAEALVAENTKEVQKTMTNEEILRHRHVWNAVTFEAGELKVVAVEKPSVVDVVRTAGAVASILMQPEKTIIAADGDEVAYVRCTAVDKDENVCPNESMKLDFTVEGAGEYLASDNGDATDLRTFSEAYCNLYHGKAMIMLRSLEGVAGDITVKASGEGVGTFEVVLKSE
ncbi:MAG: glycoside hydrolase family 2 TIM barrel-domain containing protein [Lachnospiraceae bacterium]